MQKRLFGILASAAIIVTACGGATATSAPPAATQAPAASTAASEAPVVTPAPSESNLAADQVLHINSGADDVATLDPNKAQDTQSLAVLNALHRGLVYFDKDLNVVDELAASHEVSADAKTLTFHLKDGLTYSNGDPIVAGDFVYSIKRTADPRTAAPYAYVLCEIVGADAVIGADGGCPTDKPAPKADADIEAALAKMGVTAPDDKTVVVQLSTPATYFLDVMALWITVPVQKKWITSANATEAANYVSSGPFILDTWEHQSRIVLKPNPNWSGDKPTLTEVDFSFQDVTAAQASYEAGNLDEVLVPPEDIRRVKDDPTLGPEVVDLPQLVITYYGFNNSKSPTSNLDFRIALTQAVDKQAFIDATYGGTGQIANSMIMPGIPGAQPDLNVYPYDLDSAKAHMATALKALGVANPAALGKLKFGFNAGAGHEPRVAFLAEAWSQAFPGLQFDQVGVDFPTFLTSRHAGEYILSRNGWGADYPHANNQLNGLFTCGGGNNEEQYCNKDFDALIKQAASEPDQAKQVALYEQAQTILMTDAAFLPLRWAVTRYLVKPYVLDYRATTSDHDVPGDLFYEYIQIGKH